MFWSGLILGLILGIPVGIFIARQMASAKQTQEKLDAEVSRFDTAASGGSNSTATLPIPDNKSEQATPQVVGLISGRSIFKMFATADKGSCLSAPMQIDAAAAFFMGRPMKKYQGELVLIEDEQANVWYLVERKGDRFFSSKPMSSEAAIRILKGKAPLPRMTLVSLILISILIIFRKSA